MRFKDRASGSLLAAALSGWALLAPAVAAAKPPDRPGPKDKAVLKMDADAMGTDYLDTEFAKADKKLRDAIGACGAKSCSAKVLAQIHRDLAVVSIAMGKVDAGKESFKKALELNPSMELDPDYASPEVKKALNQVRKGGDQAEKPEKPVKTEEPKPARTVGTGIDHYGVGEQTVATPVPIFAKYAGGGTKLRLWYKASGGGGDHWSPIIMTAKSGGYAAEIPCAASAKLGELPYYIEALDDGGEVVDKNGTRDQPNIVNVKTELSSDAPHMPGADPPARCKDVACEGDDCGGDKGGDQKDVPARKNWIVLTVQQDFSIIGASTDTCVPADQIYGTYSCFRADGSQYFGNPTLGDKRDTVNAGIAPSTTRILLGYDRVVVAGFVLGVRLGYVLRLGPKADGSGVRNPIPIHAEARAAYWFGANAFTTATFRPFLYAAGGFTQVDTKFNVSVQEDTSQPAPPSEPDCPPSPVTPGCNPSSQTLAAYRRMGQGFVGGGAGFMIAFVPRFGLVLDAKYMHMLGAAGNVISPELGFAVGF